MSICEDCGAVLGSNTNCRACHEARTGRPVATNDDPYILTGPYGAFLDARCRNELGYDFEDAMLYVPDEARRILADVALHRWPHLRQETR